MFKVRFIDRILLALYAALGILILIGAALYALLPSVQAVVLAAHQRLFSGWLGWALVALIALVLILWSARLIALALRRERRPDRSSVALQKTENGAVRVSLAAMEALVKQAIAHTEGVLEIRTGIVNHEDSITVRIDMVLSSNSHIPNVTMIMQRNVKRFIEEFSGIAVREVIIMVSGIRDGETPLLTAERARGVLVEPIEDTGDEASPAESPDEASFQEAAPEANADDADRIDSAPADEAPWLAPESEPEELGAQETAFGGAADAFDAPQPPGTEADEAQPAEASPPEDLDSFEQEPEAEGDADDAPWRDR